MHKAKLSKTNALKKVFFVKFFVGLVDFGTLT